MREIDKINLQVYKELYDAFNVLSKEYGIYSNVIGVFFHELMIYFTNYNIIKNDKYIYKNKINFPFLNTEYCNNPYKIDQFYNLTHDISYKHKIANFLMQTISICRLKKISISKDLTKIILMNMAVFSKYNIKLSENMKVYIVDDENQIAILEKTMYNISTNLQINNKEIFINNFIRYIRQYISDKNITISSDILLVGSNSVLSNRINSANYMYNDKLVISFAHGGVVDFTIYNEPVFGYGEFSYCNYYLSFGDNDLQPSGYSSPLNGFYPKILKYNSNIIDKIYNKKTINNNKINKNMKGLYIPTGFSANQRYGPFRDMSDDDYKIFQDVIMNLDYNITYKAHPSSNISINNHKKIVYENLIKVMNQFDYYIVDYLSTASTLVMATNKPVVYFDLGLRNMHESYYIDLYKRVKYCKIDFNGNIIKQVEEAILTYEDSTYNKEIVSKYSLSKQSLNSILKSIFIKEDI